MQNKKKTCEFHLYFWDHVCQLNELCLVDCFHCKFRISSSIMVRDCQRIQIVFVIQNIYVNSNHVKHHYFKRGILGTSFNFIPCLELEILGCVHPLYAYYISKESVSSKGWNNNYLENFQLNFVPLSLMSKSRPRYPLKNWVFLVNKFGQFVFSTKERSHYAFSCRYKDYQLLL